MPHLKVFWTGSPNAPSRQAQGRSIHAEPLKVGSPVGCHVVQEGRGSARFYLAGLTAPAFSLMPFDLSGMTIEALSLKDQ